MTDETGSHSISFSPEGNLSRYMRRIRTFPLLSVEEEQSLSRGGCSPMATAPPRTSSSTAISASPPRSPWATGATDCRWKS